jgi:PST family polysaccharide transporter
MVLAMAGQLGAAVIFGRVLPEAHVGIFWLLILFSDCFVLASSFGLHSALPKIIGGVPADHRAATAASILIIQFIVSTVIAVFVMLVWFVVRNPAIVSENQNWLSLYPYLWAVPLLAVIATQRDTALAAMAGLSRFGARAGALILGALTNVALVAAFVWWRGGGLIPLILCTVAAYLVSAVWLNVHVFGSARPRIHWRKYWDAVRFSGPLYVNNLMGFIFQRFDTVLVAILLGNPAIVAYYEMAKRIPLLFSRILTATLVPYLPGISARLAKGDRDGAARLLEKTVGLMAFLGYAFVLGILVVQRPLVVGLFSEKYLASIPVLWILMTGTCVGLQAGVFGQSLIAMGKPAMVTWANLVSAAVSIAANYFLIPRYGIIGASWAFLGTVCVSAALQLWLLRKSGLVLRWGRSVVPHVTMAGCLALTQIAPSLPARTAALAVFVTICMGFSGITIRQLVQLTAFLLPRHSACDGAVEEEIDR